VRVNVVVRLVCWLLGCVALFIDVSGEERFPALGSLLGPFLEVTFGGFEGLLLLFGHGERSETLVKLVVDDGVLRELRLDAVSEKEQRRAESLLCQISYSYFAIR